jgi:uncharacterized membrane protein (DUF2068 family)
MAGETHRSLETAVCSWRGHVTPAATTEAVEVDGLLLGVDLDGASADGPWRLARCLRCDAWIPGPGPGTDPADLALPRSGTELSLPRQGRELRQAVVMRLIAVERGIHSLIFAVVALLAFLLRVELAGVKGWVRDLLTRLTANTNGTNALGGSYLVKEGNRLLTLRSSTLSIVVIAAAAYCVVEGVEAVGLWKERRWAEYLTAVATVGFVPYEVYELTKGVSALKVGALVLNIVVLVYLIWAKRLFGLDRLRRLHEPPPPGVEERYGRPVAATRSR